MALAAPTGRAARRLEEATGEKAKTLHKLLEYSSETKTFARDGVRLITVFGRHLDLGDTCERQMHPGSAYEAVPYGVDSS